MTEVSDVAIKRTQDTLGKLIKKPVLTDKLLRKPPFKFLHDIIHAVIDTTGFFGGLYTDEELQSENIKDRDSKIAFLQKAIDTLKIATKQEVRARPPKIVAGLEADKTNELLLAIAKAIDRKIDSTEAVTLVKSGNVNLAPKKEPNKSKTSSQNKTESRKTTKDTKDPTGSKKIKNTVNSDKKPQNDKDKNAKLIKQSSKESTDSKRTKTKSHSIDKEKGRDSKKERDGKLQSQKTNVAKNITGPEHVIENTDNPQLNGNSHDIIKNGDLMPNSARKESLEIVDKHENLPNEELQKYERPEQPEIREKSGQSEKMDQPNRIENVEISNKSAKSDKQEKPIEQDNAQQNELENHLPKSAKNTDKLPPESMTNGTTSANTVQEKSANEKPRSSKSKKSHHKNDSEKISDMASTKHDEKLKSSKSVDKLIERPNVPPSKTNDHGKESKPPRTALRSAAVRPISARPSAPRRRDRNVRQILHTESFVQDSADQSKSDKKNIVPEFDDADTIVITETIPDNITSIDDIAGNKIDDGEIDGKQGHLVQQILETQTAILKSDNKNDMGISDESVLSDRKSITRNMAELRKMIQKLSLFITPLGKMMEYFQEDVDAMQIELLMWQKAGAAAEADIKEEQRTTEKLLENFKYQLAEINNSIKDHGEQINNAMMNIIQNEEKISKLITTL